MNRRERREIRSGARDAHSLQAVHCSQRLASQFRVVPATDSSDGGGGVLGVTRRLSCRKQKSLVDDAEAVDRTE